MEQSQNIAKLLEDLKKASGLSLQLADTEDGIPENAEEKLALLTAAWREKYDRNSFLRNLLCGTYSGADLYTAAARFHIPEHRRRVLFVIELKSGNSEDAVRIRREQGLQRQGAQDMIRMWRNRGYIEERTNEQLNSFVFVKLKFRNE